jgi:hypothetical protein
MHDKRYALRCRDPLRIRDLLQRCMISCSAIPIELLKSQLLLRDGRIQLSNVLMPLLLHLQRPLKKIKTKH